MLVPQGRTGCLCNVGNAFGSILRQTVAQIPRVVIAVPGLVAHAVAQARHGGLPLIRCGGRWLALEQCEQRLTPLPLLNGLRRVQLLVIQAHALRRPSPDVTVAPAAVVVLPIARPRRLVGNQVEIGRFDHTRGQDASPSPDTATLWRTN